MNGTGSVSISTNSSPVVWRDIFSGEQATGICALLVGNQALPLKPRFRSNNGKVNGTGKTNGKNKGDTLQKKMSISKLATLQMRQLLATSLDTLDVGLEVWDEQDRLVLYNKKMNALQIGFHSPEDIGQTFEDVVRKNLNLKLIKSDTGLDEEWLAQRLIKRGKNKEPVLQELADERWVNIYETRTPENYLVVAWVDVTSLVRKGRVLEAINQKLAHQSTTDGLTGLANRRRFDEALATEWQPASCQSTPLSLLMVDIDHFKKYNDHYGHLAGDECLRNVAMILDQCARRTGDLVARYGGEEFVILLPGSDLVRACEIAQKCLDLMRDIAMQHANSPICDRVSVSIGVACLLPDAGISPDLVLNAADAALYRAKSYGRARYEVANQEDWKINNDTPRTNPDYNKTVSFIASITEKSDQGVD